MMLFNKGGRGYIVPSDVIIQGGRFSEHDQRKDRKYFDPNTEAEFTEEYGSRLLKMYPKELMKMGSSQVVKKVVRLKKKTEKLEVKKSRVKK